MNHCNDTINVAKINWYGKLSELFTLITCINDANGAAKNKIVTLEHARPKWDFATTISSVLCIYNKTHNKNVKHPRNWRMIRLCKINC